jgi:glycogen debranching enzyme
MSPGSRGKDGAIARTMVRLRPRPDTLYVSSGRTVLATDRGGFIDNGPDHGLFVHETRLLSRYRYRIDGVPLFPVALSSVTQRSWLGYYIAPAAAFAETSGGSPAAENPLNAAAQNCIELRLSRYTGEGLHEDVDLTNFTQAQAELTLILELESDFADQTETHGKRVQCGDKTTRWAGGESHWEWRSDYEAVHHYSHQGKTGEARLRRGIAIRFSKATSPPQWDGERIAFHVALEPRARWHCCVDHVPILEDRELVPRYGCRSFSLQDNDYDRRTRIFSNEATVFSNRDSGSLASVVVGALEQGKQDLAGLRLFDLDRGDRAWTSAAGLPMYVALFGRDTLTVAWEAAPVTTDLMRGTLPVLAEWQGKEIDNWRDEQPGRMLHEAHTGPLSALNYIPQGRNYGSMTTSGFYPFVVAQLWHWTGDKEVVRPFLDPAMAALKWLRDHKDDSGFYKYRTRSEQGVANQGWKDSADAIVYEDGSQVSTPIATCEEQGIVYAAKLNLAEVLWWFGRKDEAKQLYREATELKKRFNEAFWMEDEGFLAMALDADNHQVRSIGSNALHCIATGIANKTFVDRSLQRLFEPDMFSGWGVRTLSSQHPAYNPYSYHRGTVWPVEHGPFAIGAYRYGCHEYVERVCRSQFETASLFDFYRLPECIAGHPRDEDHPFPALYPAANSPQAWSATTVYTLMQAMLGLQPFAPLRILFVDPYLPEWLPELTLSGLRVADAVVSIRFFRKANGNSSYEILETRGSLHVIRQPSPWSFTASLGERAGDLFTSLFHASN